MTKESKGQRAAGGNDDVAGELIRLRRQIGEVYDRLGDLIYKLGLLSKRQEGLTAVLTAQRQLGPTAEKDSSMKPIVFVVRVRKDLDGTMWVQIEDRDPLPLPEALANLLVLVAKDSGVRVKADDPFVGWKSRESIAAELGINKHAVIQRVLRLKKQLDPELVQSSRKLGVRFGLHRNGTLVTESDAG